MTTTTRQIKVSLFDETEEIHAVDIVTFETLTSASAFVVETLQVLIDSAIEVLSGEVPGDEGRASAMVRRATEAQEYWQQHPAALFWSENVELPEGLTITVEADRYPAGEGLV